MAKRPTIKTIAELAGVSHVAVSRALRGASDISPETTARIQRIAREVGYTPNAFARNLSSRRSGGIGMVIPSMGEHSVYIHMYNEISRVAAEHNYLVSLGSCGGDIELEKKYCRMMCENQMGALIVAPVSGDVSHIKEICGPLVPVIYVGGKAPPDEEYSVQFDYRHSAGLAVDHFARLGHRDIALFGCGPESQTIHHKTEGYKAEMEGRGLVPRIYHDKDAQSKVEAGERLAERLLAEGQLPTAIWCMVDLMAVGVMKALARHGIQVPKDVSLIGHDNIYCAEFPGLELTTITVPKPAIATHTIRLALSLMKEHNEEMEPKKVFASELVVRGSTAAPAR